MKPGTIWKMTWLGSAFVVGAPQLLAQQNGGSPATPLETRVDQLDQQIRVLQRLREIAADSAAAAAKDKQSATANAKDGLAENAVIGRFQTSF
jgi:hypothetical protein